MQQSKNSLVQFIAERGRMCANSIIGSNLRLLKRTYNTDLQTKIKLQSNQCGYKDLMTVQAVKDILSGQLPDFFSNNEICIFLFELCVN